MSRLYYKYSPNPKLSRILISILFFSFPGWSSRRDGSVPDLPPHHGEPVQLERHDNQPSQRQGPGGHYQQQKEGGPTSQQVRVV